MCGLAGSSVIEDAIVIDVSFRRLMILATLAILSGCGGDHRGDSGAAGASVAKREGARPSQILITIEAFAGRRAAPFGGSGEMPKLATLVSAGTTYDDAVSTTTLARPALVTILTGVCPDRSGVRDNIHDAL